MFMPLPPTIRPPYMRPGSMPQHSAPVDSPPNKHNAIRQALKDLGVSRWGLASLEANYLPGILHPQEIIGGVLYGFCRGSFAILLATDRRIIFLDKKPLFVDEDEINYRAVSGISYSRAGLGSTVTLHTRMKDYIIRTFNEHCAQGFMAYLESRCLERPDDRRSL